MTLTTPLLTSPLDDPSELESDTEASELDFVPHTYTKKILHGLSPRHEKGQPYPIVSNQQLELCTLTELPNRISLKVSKRDGGVLFLIPSKVHDILFSIFKFYSSDKKTLTQDEFYNLVTTIC